MRVVFLDRDGVINWDRGYVHRIKDFEFLPDAILGMKELVNMGFNLIVVTNQSGLARGYFDLAAFSELTEWMCDILRRAGAPLLDVYFCPHHPQGIVEELSSFCTCRKPAPGMLLHARDKYRINMSESVIVGDRETDMIAGWAAGVHKCYLVGKDSVASNGLFTSLPNLAACAVHLRNKKD